MVEGSVTTGLPNVEIEEFKKNLMLVEEELSKLNLGQFSDRKSQIGLGLGLGLGIGLALRSGSGSLNSSFLEGKPTILMPASTNSPQI